MKETELWELLISLSANEISLAEAHDSILRLFSIVERSEQLKCDVCGSTNVIEAPHMGRNCNDCHPL